MQYMLSSIILYLLKHIFGNSLYQKTAKQGLQYLSLAGTFLNAPSIPSLNRQTLL